jgi:predicted nucleic acid-binding protein
VSGLVLDCSVAAAWCFDDEASPETDAVLTRVREERAFVPYLFHLEIANVLVGAERRGRITASGTANRLSLIATLPISMDLEPRSALDIADLARATQLTVYDASYLDLSLRRGLALATKDRQLQAAARRLGVTLLLDDI